LDALVAQILQSGTVQVKVDIEGRRNLAAELSEALMNCNFAAKGPDRP
jgi:hypothetical protein